MQIGHFLSHTVISKSVSNLKNHTLLDGLFSLVIPLRRARVFVAERLLHILKPCPHGIEKMAGEGRAARVRRVAAEAVAIDFCAREGGIENITDRLIAHGHVAPGLQAWKEHMLGIVDLKASVPKDFQMLLDGSDGNGLWH